MRAVDVLESLELLGSSQWGLVTTAQASEVGVSKMQLSRLADRGTVQRVRHGVYALPSANTGPLQGVRAAWLATGSQPAGNQPLAVVSGESAAAVHGLGDLLPSRYEFTTAVRRQTTQPDTRYRKRDLPDADVSWVNGLPVTTVARTVKDLATVGIDFDHLAVAVRDAVTTTDVTYDALAQALESAAERFRSPDGNALLVAALKTSGYLPDARVLELLAPQLQEMLLRTLAPHLEEVVRQAFAEQLRQLAPGIDLRPAAQDVRSATLPDTKAITRVSPQIPPDRQPELRRTAGQKRQAQDAVRRQDRDIEVGTRADSAGSEPSPSVPRDKAGQRGEEPWRRG
ncbi:MULTISPECIES: type IV toxin-antitoxin system AbiEi family antitoxin domain-containing protein [unclassified Kribbella]|uniref:type IV toxin-antitoxin system AbiEi family antitoxin domain-containing protein n=1 Tax=unclassified Kribbella TaxID=2644121 RepID=UPI0033FCB7CE